MFVNPYIRVITKTAIFFCGLSTVTLMAQRLQVIQVKDLCLVSFKRNDVIDFSRQSATHHADWMLTQITPTKLRPSIVIAA